MTEAEMPELLTEEQVAAMGIAKRQTLANWRSTRRDGPPFVKLGKIVRYPKQKLLAWLNENTVTPGK